MGYILGSGRFDELDDNYYEKVARSVLQKSSS